MDTDIPAIVRCCKVGLRGFKMAVTGTILEQKIVVSHFFHNCCQVSFNFIQQILNNSMILLLSVVKFSVKIFQEY